MAALEGSMAPPNSLAAVQACLNARAAHIEIDVVALAEDDYLLVHDDVLESETSGIGPVAACSVAQARQLHIRNSEHPVALLSDVVKAIARSDAPARLQIDYKNIYPFASDEPLRRLLRLIAPLGERVIVSSIADWQLRALHRLAPALALGFDIQLYLDLRRAEPGTYPHILGVYGYWDDHMLATRRLWSHEAYLRDRSDSLIGQVPGVRAFYVRHQLLTQSLEDGFNWAAALHTSGIELDAWTIDSPQASASALRLREAGVDLFTSNTPSAMTKLIG
ncbi:MAG TPA: glycerophosphodiester phosphodiesterase family protein [Anaerolineae bacterium]|jgi:glycerophosphoryl diester phosphodiesterase